MGVARLPGALAFRPARTVSRSCARAPKSAVHAQLPAQRCPCPRPWLLHLDDLRADLSSQASHPAIDVRRLFVVRTSPLQWRACAMPA